MLRSFGAGRATGAPLGRPFHFFQVAVGSSDLADGIYKIAIPLVALDLNRSAAAVSLVGVAVRLPWLVATLPAGVLADRYRPRRVMRWAAVGRLALVALLCALAILGALPLVVLALIAFVVGAAGTVVDVSAQSMVPRLVTREQLPRANALLQSVQTLLAQLVGPALGGFVVSLGAGLGLSTTAVLYVVSVGALGMVPAAISRRAARAPAGPAPGPAPASGPSLNERRGSLRSVVSDLGVGLRYFRGRPDLRRLALSAAVNNLAYAMTLTLLPLRAVAPGPLNLSQTGYGLLLTCLAIGSVIAGPLTGRVVRRIGEWSLMRVGPPLMGVCFLALAVPNVVAVALGLLGYGLVIIVWNVAVVSYRQRTIPEEVFGRANAAYRWITWGVFPVGSALAGVLATAAGMTPIFLLAGALPIVVGLALPVGAHQLTPPPEPAHQD